MVFAALVGSSNAQGPKAYFQFNGNTNDSSGTGIITTVTPSAGWAPAYTTDRNGAASSAIIFDSARSLQLQAPSLAGNSNQALGLRNAGGTNTPFTLSAWVRFTSSGSGQGYSTIFGNLGSGAGTLHAGLNNNSANAHFGFDGNDVNGAVLGVSNSVWYHIAFVYDTTLAGGSGTAPCQRIYINGVPEITRWSPVNNTLKVADLYLGNWGAANDAANDLKGHLDDVAIFDVALKADQIQALANGVSPMSLPAAGTYSGPKLPGVFGTAGQWGIREIKGYPGIAYGTLINADRIIKTYATTPGGTVSNYLAPVINFNDPEGGGNLGYFAAETNFATNTAGGDDSFLMIARAGIRIPTSGDYTFGFRGDDGSRLRILGKQFTSSTRIANGNPADPAHNGDGLFYVNGTGDSNTLGVVNLPAGDYSLEFAWWEGSGGASIEVYAAPGAKTSVDNAFQLIGNTALGGLEIVRDPSIVPTFTVNGANSLFIHGGAPANFTLDWSVAEASTSLSIDQGIGPVADSGSSNFSAPASTRTYTMTATTPIAVGNDAQTKSVTVYVNSAPVINTFTASDTTVTAGAAVTLNWNVIGASTLILQPGNIDVTGQTSRVVNPGADTTYTLVATNPSGNSQQQVAIDVGAAPTVNSFTANETTPMYNREVVLSWNVSNGDTLSINQGVGPISGVTGSVSVIPLVSTTYTLTATNTYGSSTMNRAITVATPIGVTPAGAFTVQRFNSSIALPYPGMGYLQSVDALIAGTNRAGMTSPTANVTTINYSDGADGDFTSGNSAFPSLGVGMGNNHFAIRATATLNINTPGEYTFIVNSDDGARLRVDGQDVIVDDATHAPGSSAGTIVLTKPQVSIELVYYDVEGGAEVELSWIRPNLQWQLLGVAAASSTIVHGGLRISEFVADNAGSFEDEDGMAADWIEIWNSSNAPINLSGYFLTDLAGTPSLWAFPAWTLNPNQYVVVFASGKDRKPAQAVAGQDNPGTLAQPRLHTNFNLQKDGEYLGLWKSDGVGGYTMIHEYGPTFPAQKENVSYGISDTEAFVGYMETVTPGYPSAITYTGFVADTVFSHQRGRYSAAFNLVIDCATPDATIRYTTDGSLPTLNKGNIYTGPINVNSTRVVRAAAFKPGWRPTNVETKSYLFIDDIVNQNAAHAVALGFPATAVNGQVFRYGMSLAPVTAGGGNLQSLKNALAAAPSVIISTDMANFADPSTGIYTNPTRHGRFWERPASMEMIDVAGASAFQIDCGIRIRGGASRSSGNAKHAFHAYFRNLYEGDLKYRLFGFNGAPRFDQIDLRCEQNYSWSKDNNSQNSLMREEWSRATQRDMGQPYARDGYFHLYINGVYWGIFNWEERTEADFGASYLGGSKETFDTVKSAGSSGGYNTEMTDGNFAAWRLLFDKAMALKNDATEAGRTAKLLELMGKNPDGTANPAYPVLLDLDNLADFMLVVFYDGSFDAPMSTFLSNASNNWFGVRDRVGSRGFVFFAHDHEHGMDSTGTNSYNRVGPWGTVGATSNNWGQTWSAGQYGNRETFNKFNPQYLHEFLCFSAEYRLRFADRVHRHFFNGGALTATSALARVDAMVPVIDSFIHAEAARWGSTGLHRNTWFNTARVSVRNFINNGGAIPGGHPALTAGTRTDIVLQQLKGYQEPTGTAKPLYPQTLNAPTFSGTFGGVVAPGYSFNITNPNGATGTLYYTLDGSDPRSIGGAINPAALTGASPRNVVLTQTRTVKARVYHAATTTWSALTEASYTVGVPASASSIVVSQIHYNPDVPNDLTEFVEIMNISAGSVDLTGCEFDAGITFHFPAGFVLAPGARGLIVKDVTAFTSAYPGVPPSQIAGAFELGTALNNDGEQIRLMSATALPIRDFSYSNLAPWPKGPDGNGPSLVLKHPFATPTPNHGLGTNWRSSFEAGGSPNANDALLYSTWATSYGLVSPTGDDDLDGAVNLLEYALGTNPMVGNGGDFTTGALQQLTVDGIPNTYLTLTYTRAIGRDSVNYQVEGANDLNAPSWSPAVQVGNTVFNGDGTETLTFRYPVPVTIAPPTQLLRLRVVQIP